MHSNKTWHRPDTRQRQHRPSPDRNYPKIAEPKTHKVGAVEAAARVANLKLLLSRVDGDIAMLAAAVQLEISGLKQRLEGLEVVEDGLAMYIEETLALDPSWLDKKHDSSDISAKTVDILYGRDISDSEEEIRQSEQRGHEIMKNAAASANAAPATRAPHTPSIEKPSEEIILTRIANLVLLTQARGAKSRLARLLDVSESIISFLFNRKKEFTHRFTRDLETALSLPAEWFDTVQEIQAVPQATWDILGSSASSTQAPRKSPKSPKASASAALAPSVSKPSAKLAKVAVTAGHNEARSTAANAQAHSPETAHAGGTPAKAPRVHRIEAKKSQGAPELTLHLSTTSAPSELLLDTELPELQQHSGVPEVLPELDDVASNLAPADAEAPLEKQQAPVAAVPAPAPVVVVRTRRALAPHAPALATGGASNAAAAGASAPEPSKPVPEALSVAPAAAQTPTALPQVEQPVAQPEPARGFDLAINNDISSKPDTLVLGGFVLQPITEALIKTLAQKARDGRFNEKAALRLLVEIAEL